MWNIKTIDHIGKDEYFARVVFLYPFYLFPCECILKEGDRMEHKDDVLMDKGHFYETKHIR